jgi:hypothetical protein
MIHSTRHKAGAISYPSKPAILNPFCDALCDNLPDLNNDLTQENSPEVNTAREIASLREIIEKYNKQKVSSDAKLQTGDSLTNFFKPSKPICVSRDV